MAHGADTGICKEILITVGSAVGRNQTSDRLSDRSNEAFTRSDRRTDRSARPRLRPTAVRPVGQIGRTDCSRTAHICQSNQCGLLANYNTAYAAAWLVVRLASRSDQSDVCPHASTVGSAVGRNQTCLILPTVCPTVGRSVYTIRSSDRPVGQTSRTDRSVRRSERVNTQLHARIER